MPHLIEYKLGPQTTILVESGDVASAQGQQQVGARGVVVEKASEAFNTALAGIKPIASSVLAQMREAVPDAQEIQVEFGIKLTAAAGVVLSNVSSEGHCRISIKWVPTPPGKIP